jgi:hypothetical protein
VVVERDPSLSAKAGFEDEAGAESPPFSREGENAHVAAKTFIC